MRALHSNGSVVSRKRMLQTSNVIGRILSSIVERLAIIYFKVSGVAVIRRTGVNVMVQELTTAKKTLALGGNNFSSL